MNPNERIKVIELRNYLIKPGVRDRFIDYFAKHFVDSQNALGGFVLGAFRIEDEPDRFFWIRGFSDMDSRSRFLPEFYGGEVWKKFGAAANEMMLEWHKVHLLKPLEETNAGDFPAGNGLTVIDFYLAGDAEIEESVKLLQPRTGGNSSFWVSEMTANDFPPLPVIQDENLLTAITNYKEKAVSQAGEKDSNPTDEAKKSITKSDRLILFPVF
jgi:hypothetical protein